MILHTHAHYDHCGSSAALKERSGAPLAVHVEASLDPSPYGVAGRVTVTPGHTRGSLTVLTEEGHAFVGDLLGGGWFIGAPFPGRPRQ